ncbi:MAG: hypothetical protein QM753_07790 [Thermomicrobiales bacterium]
MEGREFLRVAASLLDTGDDEAFRRASVGRSYYAAFLEARSFCEQYFGLVRRASGGEHQTVPHLIAAVDPFLADGVRILRSRRNVADYDTHVSPETVSLAFANDAFILARSIVDALDAHAARLELQRSEVSGSEGETGHPAS